MVMGGKLLIIRHLMIIGLSVVSGCQLNFGIIEERVVCPSNGVIFIITKLLILNQFTHRL